MTRSEKLDRLTISSPCSESWDGMQGDERLRHCRECGKQVHDLSQMTPREIAALVEGSRGRLCARLTRDDRGRLVTLEIPDPPLPAAASGSWRVSPVAAAVVGGLLGLGGGASASPAPAATAPEVATPEAGARPQPVEARQLAKAAAGLCGQITDDKGKPIAGAEVVARNGFDGQERSTVTGEDGRFAFDGLAAGLYALDARARGFLIEPRSGLLLHPRENQQVGLEAKASGESVLVTLGGVGLAEEPLRRLFDESDLVVLAIASSSVKVPDRSGPYTEVATEFLVRATLKGKAPGHGIRVHHVDDAGQGERFPPGTRMLAFLELREGQDGRPVYEPTGYSYGLKVLPETRLEAYRERTLELARLSRHGRPHPAEVVEWLVETAEEPLTRGEAAGELAEALESLAQLAESRGTAREQTADDLRAVVDRFLREGGSFEGGPVPAVLAAFLINEQVDRLAEAFRTTPLLEGDAGLYRVIRPRAGEAALSWLVQKVRKAGPEAELGRDVLYLLSKEIEDDKLEGLLAAADEELSEYISSLPDGDPEEEQKRIEVRAKAIEKELRHQFVQALGDPAQPIRSSRTAPDQLAPSTVR